MAQATGSNAELLIGFETTFGTDASAGFKMPFNSCDIVGSRNMNSAATITGARDPVEPFSGNQSVSGQVTVPVDSSAFAYWMKAMLGDPTSSGTDPYNHVFTVPDTQDSLTIEIGYTDISQYIKYNGCKINGMTIDIGGDGELVANFDVVGAKYNEPAGTSFDGTPTDVSLARLSNFQAAVKEGSTPAEISNATSVNVNIGCNLDTSQYVIGGGGILGAIPEGIVSVGGNLTALFEDDSLIDKAINVTESGLQITFTNGSSSIVDIYMPEIYYSVATPPVSGPQGIVQSLDFQGFYANNATTSALQITVTNTTASY